MLSHSPKHAGERRQFQATTTTQMADMQGTMCDTIDRLHGREGVEFQNACHCDPDDEKHLALHVAHW